MEIAPFTYDANYSYQLVFSILFLLIVHLVFVLFPVSMQRIMLTSLYCSNHIALGYGYIYT